MKLLKYVISILLSALGFSACMKEEVGPAEYGTPIAGYTIKAKAKNKKEVPIEGLKIVASYDDYRIDSTQTDIKGEAVLDFQFFPVKNIHLEVSDSSSNFYKSKLIELKFENEDFVGKNGNWFNGKVNVEEILTMEENSDE